MTLNHRFATLLMGVSALSLTLSSQAQHAHLHDDAEIPARADIGDVNFRPSCDSAVQEDFNHALALMHHMMYAQARKAFKAVAAADPDCGMAHWGIATTLFQPLWGTRPAPDELARGWREIQRARELVPAEGRERALVKATESFFQAPENAEFRTRMDRWTQAMADAYEAHPEDPDVAAMYALSRLRIAQRSPSERDALHDEAERILRDIWEEHPGHPGAVHYSIHATDADGRAANALDMVGSYGRIAPEVPHALHMPSHIYVRLARWDEVIDWNKRSAKAALREPVEGAASHHYIHAIDYLVYAYLQKGEDDNARVAYDQAIDKERHQASFISAYHLAAMPARMAVERRNWEAAAAIEPRTPDYLPWDAARWPEGIQWYARGLGAVHAGQLEKAQEAERRLAALSERAREEDDDLFATYIEVDRQILAGWLAHVSGDHDEAIRLLQSAAELERTVEKHPVSPGALLPPNEALGDLLLDLDRPAEAMEAYLASNERWPGRFNTLLGGARAAEAAGDMERAHALYGELLERAADSRRPALEEAERRLEGFSRVD
jgi:tetratricopeptide (TPR) repeat protein